MCVGGVPGDIIVLFVGGSKRWFHASPKSSKQNPFPFQSLHPWLDTNASTEFYPTAHKNSL